MDEADLTKGMEHMRPYVSVAPSQPELVQKSQANPESLQSIENPAALRSRSPSNPHHRADISKFGSRYLQDGDDVFEFNAWDSVPLTPDFLQFAEQQYSYQRSNPVSDFDKRRFNDAPEKWWDRFYANNHANFFKDRKWLFKEFPGLEEMLNRPSTVLEVGCGAGNTAFPLLDKSENQELKVHCCDFSKSAVDVVRKSKLFDPNRMRADVWDVTSVGANSDGISLPPGLDKDSADIVILIFVFSALSPSQWSQAISNIHAVLKPGGEILFRDYGRGDLAQVRFKKGRWMDENFYIRGDGTRVYFFTKEELTEIFSGVTSENIQAKNIDKTAEEGDSRPKFEILDLGTDRRMLVNRRRRLKMYRCWMQGRFRKPLA